MVQAIGGSINDYLLLGSLSLRVSIDPVFVVFCMVYPRFLCTRPSPIVGKFVLLSSQGFAAVAMASKGSLNALPVVPDPLRERTNHLPA